MPNTVECEANTSRGILAGKQVILGVTGGIAAYKSAYLASALVQRGADVHVVMTEHATQLIGPATFWSLTGNPVITGLFDPPVKPEITHVSLPESADLFLVAPATANFIGKLANGLADDMLSTMALVVRCPVILAPAMNVNMYTNPAVVANMDRLRQRDTIIIQPESGRLACGDEGVGRLADPDVILRAAEEALIGGPRDLVGVKFLVTAGPTREPIDPVRFISNRSSGKMGYAIAEMAAKRGADVTLVSGPTDLEPPAGVSVVDVTTVQEMFDAVTSLAEGSRVFISAAAPADFTPAHIQDQKIKKSAHLILELDKARDILAEVGRKKGKTVLVGFAAETENLEEYAEGKLVKKNLDLIVANDVSCGSDVIGSDSNQVTLISRTGDKVCWPRMSKREVARVILDYVKNHFLEELS
ncbi:MAG: bifunctional phosphopantothenoylcysteine decarboxylase/phosphopantothenate--cysteine ligase CoaBC [Armatimonadetes bacterium]|nr:bifunctional phosphopantothenoylcysteine decarboxylase/phosphopantothenate--cysteine ligase CoaBC [Armatimonadota bacterium]